MLFIIKMMVFAAYPDLYEFYSRRRKTSTSASFPLTWNEPAGFILKSSGNSDFVVELNNTITSASGSTSLPRDSRRWVVFTVSPTTV